jgi:frataxin
MNESEFIKLADNTIEKLANAIEDADLKGQIEVDLLGGVLSIELMDGKKYIINRHDASKQIWLSSPISGAAHFNYENGNWISSYSDNFLDIIANEMRHIADIDIMQ